MSVGWDNERVEMFEYPGSGYTYQLREVTRCIQTGLTESATMPLDDSLAIMELFDDARRQIGVRYANDTRTDLYPPPQRSVTFGVKIPTLGHVRGTSLQRSIMFGVASRTLLQR